MADPVDVYPYRVTGGMPEFLILKRAEQKKYSGQWRMVAGKKEEAEAAWQSGLRELREETGLFPDMYWTVPSINQFYDPETDSIHHIPVFAAKINSDYSIKLNEEHTEYKWVESGQVNIYIHWPEQRRLIALINDILINKKILKEWKIPL